jgi:hypothetical protein
VDPEPYIGDIGDDESESVDAGSGSPMGVTHARQEKTVEGSREGGRDSLREERGTESTGEGWVSV